MIGTFKKLSYGKKLGLYFSLLASLVLKIFLVQSFKQSELKKSTSLVLKIFLVQSFK